ncbi:hypothetical protein G6F56_011653 [Rhizopus delemar]|nr:hypothetical protein G6F56_011653 [Rhizopus delemar]
MALITTFMTTPMVVYLYPKHHQTQPVDYIDSCQVDVAKDEEKSVHAKRYCIVTLLNRVESLAPTMALLQFFRADRVEVHALRLLELTQRTSDVMKIKTEQQDPILNVLKTFANLVGIQLQTSLEFAQDEIKTISDRATDVEADIVILPYYEESNETYFRAFATLRQCKVGVFVDRGFGVTQHTTPQQIIVACEEDDDTPLRFALKLQSFHKAPLVALGKHFKSQWATRESIRGFMEGREGELFISQNQSNVESKHVEQLTAHAILDSTISQDIIILSRHLAQKDHTDTVWGPLATQLLNGNTSILVVQ